MDEEMRPTKGRHRREAPQEEDRRKVLGAKNYAKALFVVKANRGAKKVLTFAIEAIVLALLVGIALFFINRNGEEWAEKYKIDAEVNLPSVTAKVPDKETVTPSVEEVPDVTSIYTWTPEGAKENITFLYPFEWEPLAEIVDGKYAIKEFVSSNNEALLITYRTAKKPTQEGLEKIIAKQFKNWNKSEPPLKTVEGKYHAVTTAQAHWKKQSLKRYVGGYLAPQGYFVITLTYQDTARASDISPDTVEPIVTTGLIE